MNSREAAVPVLFCLSEASLRRVLARQGSSRGFSPPKFLTAAPASPLRHCSFSLHRFVSG